MIIPIDPEVTKLEEEIKIMLRGTIWRFCYERGVQFQFINDSKCINDCIESIAQRAAYLILNTKLDKDVIEMQRTASKDRQKMRSGNRKEYKVLSKSM
jgi:hypothetical protein